MPDRPNILLILTDQQRGDCLGIAGHPVLQTPNLDSIAGAGAQFTRAYSTCPSCIAARRNLLSGQFPSTHGMVGYQEGVAWEPEATLPGVLREAGYQTWFVGRDMHQHPKRKRFGYDHMVCGDYDGEPDYARWLRAHGPAGQAGIFGAGLLNNDWTARPWYLPEYLHYTNWVTDRALEFLEQRDPTCSFFLTVSYLAPHPPLQPPAFYFERYLRTGVPDPAIGDWEELPAHDGAGDDVASPHVHLQGEALLCARAAYYGAINHIDDQLRRLLDRNTAVGRLTSDNTVVIFTSDHGEMLGDHYRWRKTVPYEGSARIPLLVRAPERFGVKPRTLLDQPVCLEDIMPTALDFTGLETPSSVEGRSLLPLLRGESVPWREALHIEHAPLHHTLTDGKEKFIWWVADGREQFFDLTTDPTECHDLIREAAAQARIAHWRQRLVKELAPRPEGFSDGRRLIPGRPYAPVLPTSGR